MNTALVEEMGLRKGDWGKVSTLEWSLIKHDFIRDTPEGVNEEAEGEGCEEIRSVLSPTQDSLGLPEGSRKDQRWMA